MIDQDRRPRFIECFLEDLQEGYRTGGVTRLLPLYGFVFLCIGAAIAWLVPVDFWSDSWSEGHRDISTSVYGAAMTFNGLLLALSWSAFSKIHELIGAHGFSSWLKKNKMLHHYIFVVDFVQLWQIVALLASGLALLSVLLNDVPILAHRAIMTLMLGTTAYAIRWAVGAVQIMHDVVWYKAIYDERESADRGESRAVVPFTLRP